MSLHRVYRDARGVQHVIYFEGEDTSLILNCNLIASAPYVRGTGSVVGHPTCIACLVYDTPFGMGKKR